MVTFSLLSWKLSLSRRVRRAGRHFHLCWIYYTVLNMACSPESLDNPQTHLTTHRLIVISKMLPTLVTVTLLGLSKISLVILCEFHAICLDQIHPPHTHTHFLLWSCCSSLQVSALPGWFGIRLWPSVILISYYKFVLFWLWGYFTVFKIDPWVSWMLDTNHRATPIVFVVVWLPPLLNISISTLYKPD